MDQLKQFIEREDRLQLYLVSDSGTKGDLGSFGWELAIGQTILWTCMGPTSGLHPGSFCAESYGILSVILVLKYYFHFFEVQVADIIEHLLYCNNQGLLKCINFSLDCSRDDLKTLTCLVI
jgi:hypothetical protein